MSENTRKAVVTTAQVESAFQSYVSAQVRIGNDDLTGHVFGKDRFGFAEFDSSDRKADVVREFPTKEAALTFYGTLAEGMWIVLDAVEAGALVKSEDDVTEAGKAAAA